MSILNIEFYSTYFKIIFFKKETFLNWIKLKLKYRIVKNSLSGIVFLNNVIPLKSYEVAKGRPIISLRTTGKSTQILKAISLKSSAICWSNKD